MESATSTMEGVERVELVCRGGLATLRLEEERPVTREEYRGSREARCT